MEIHTEIQRWVVNPEPVNIACYRDLGVGELHEVKWQAKSGGRAMDGQLQVTVSLLQRVANVAMMLAEEEAASATSTTFHGILPYGTTTHTSTTSAYAPNISDMVKWLVFKTVPAHDGCTRPYMTLKVVLAPQGRGTITKVNVAVINPIEPLSVHVLDQWDALVTHWMRDKLFGPDVT